MGLLLIGQLSAFKILGAYFPLDYIVDVALLFSGFEGCQEFWRQIGLQVLESVLIFLPGSTGHFFPLY